MQTFIENLSPTIAARATRTVMRSVVAATGCLLLVGAAQAQASARFSGNVIRIGVLGDRSGVFRDITGPGSEVAARMAVEEMGSQVAGVKVEVVAADHQNKPDIGATVARKWYEADGVDMITDLGNSAVALAVRGISKQLGRVDMISGGGVEKLQGSECSATGFQWTWDTFAIANVLGRALMAGGGESWYLLSADYAFGHAMEAVISDTVKKLGGTISGTARHPLSTADFSSYLLRAQSSGAKVVALGNSGADFSNSLKQAAEFGLTRKQQVAGMVVFITDVKSIGLQTAQGLRLATGFYWDLDDKSRSFAAAFEKRHGAKPTAVQAGVYSATLNYLKAVAKAGTDEPKAVSRELHKLPIEDAFARNGRVLANGRMIYDWYLAQVKSPAESKGPWDFYKIERTVAGKDAFMSVEQSGCRVSW